MTDESRRLRDQGPTQGTLSDAALRDEAHGDSAPQSPGELGHKVAAEAGEADGPVDKLKRAAHELDRDLSGEYERRSDDTAAEPRTGR